MANSYRIIDEAAWERAMFSYALGDVHTYFPYKFWKERQCHSVV